MKRALFALIAWLAVAPSAYADFISLEVLGGYLTRSSSSSTGLSNWELSLFGNGFEVHATNRAPGCSRTQIQPGVPFTQCLGTNNEFYFIGSGSVLSGGIAQQVNFDDVFYILGGAPMSVSGATQAVLTQPVSFAGGFVPCTGLPTCRPFETTYFLNMNAMVGSYSINLQLNESGEAYNILEETYAFHVPEPSTLLLTAIGLLGVLVYSRRLRAQSGRRHLGTQLPPVRDTSTA
jgi:PEP-CTERM motif-containing protein